MLLEPSRYTLFLDRRELLGRELSLGGHGQIPLTAAGFNYVPDTSYNFYEIHFTSASVVSAVQFADFYAANPNQYKGMAFPANYVWYAPLSGIALTSGSAIAYEYKRLSDTCGGGC